ncbi:unnamed protein product [Camellia sinensis]
MSELANRLQRLKEQSQRVEPGVLQRDRDHPGLESIPGVVTKTPPSQIGNMSWGNLVEEGIESQRFEGVKDNIQMGDKVKTSLEGMVFTQDPSTSCPETLGLRDLQVRLVDKEDRGLPSRGDWVGPGYGSYRGGRGRGGRGYHLPDHSVAGNPVQSTSQKPVKTWADVANIPSRSHIKLRYIPPPSSDNPNVVELPPRIGDLGKWEACLVGYFLDKKLPYNYVKNSVSNQWKIWV